MVDMAKALSGVWYDMAAAMSQSESMSMPIRSAAPFFEQDDHREAVLRYIVEGILPLKFAYAGSAALAHDVFASSDGYQTVIGSVEHEVSTLCSLSPPVPSPHSVLEIGPGNGMHTIMFLNAIAARGLPCRRYVGLDFSRTLLGIACQRIRRALRDTVRVRGDLWDIESGPTVHLGRWRCGTEPLLVCMLGHTLGNLESIGTTLRHIRNSLRPHDVLLTSLALRAAHHTESMVLAPYRSAVFRDAALEPLRAAGVDLDDVDFDVRYVAGSVIGQAVFRRSAIVGDTRVPEGHTLRCFCSRRFTQDDVFTLFQASGWWIRNATLDETGDHMVLAATPYAIGDGKTRWDTDNVRGWGSTCQEEPK